MNDEHQIERAQGAFELHIDVAPTTESEFDRLRKSLRLSRADVPWLREHIPGGVRRGARVDLQPVVTRLRAAGHAASLRRRAPEPEAES